MPTKLLSAAFRDFRKVILGMLAAACVIGLVALKLSGWFDERETRVDPPAAVERPEVDAVAELVRAANEPDQGRNGAAPAEEKFTAHFTGRSNIEIKNSTGMLDLEKDFTIEAWVRWTNPGIFEMFAGDEAWPEMSKEVPVNGPRGWTLRKLPIANENRIDFTVGTEKSWLSLTAPIPATADGWVHIAVCRHENQLTLFFDGKQVAGVSVRDKKLLKSPTPVYLGVPKHAHWDRKFGGYMRGFRMSAAALYGDGFTPPEKLGGGDSTLVLFNFVNSSGPEVADESGNHRDGLLDGAELASLQSVDAALANPTKPDRAGETAAQPENAPAPGAVKPAANGLRLPPAQSVRVPETSWFAAVDRQAPFACSGQTNSYFADDRSLRTGLTWEKSPALAAQKAGTEGKLVFLIHVSGNFEDPGFT